MNNNLPEISFYKLTALPILKAAPKLIEKIYYSEQKLVVIAEQEDLLQSLDKLLWSYSTKHFIPHATFQDPHPSDQPIYLTHNMENPNDATITMVLGIVELNNLITDKCIYMFDGNDKSQLAFARKTWQAYKKQGNSIIYWQQNAEGSWARQD